jgi:hypothetical protein
MAGIGISDEYGSFISYVQKQCFAAVLSDSKAKAAGCEGVITHKSLVQLQELGVQRVNIEGGCKAQFCRNAKNKNIIHCLQNYRISFIKRQANFVAHILQ